ncbi:Succinate-semialdehyde dehydrogenase [NADP(+)] 1 [Zhongshania aliphaticivorans]|uniref:Succinate-semialdehyde dehydrogenase [NADP(+)] 1 n=1 Tax=Zhongshania aliphaticivorans TaxID=1470434 RepID=A0A5S9NN82_9GAMM|nr:NAD-dependent succinate-semialdehyde dehydrogenase [Zhongshania aliphaticivorans]CAA0091804.1 Succinate-semialdehyde dehydrogenase [NADP(+)] 1 [Zhongshania aliphaticivorans]CAA0099140.1 Succinate-semialdehyde dehydrogenase [NADP(+)] 1 [Zhongshania aliphaticivorans]
MLTAKNPSTGEIIAEYPTLNNTELHEHIGDAFRAADQWQACSYEERAQTMRAVAAELRKQKDHLAELMAIEMGKPIKEGGPEVEKAAGCAEYYAEHAAEHLAPQTLPSDASISYVCHPPLGTLLGILPWNAPLWLAFRYLAPALMAGNTCVMKHDPNVPACAAAIVKVFADAGAPDNIVVNLPIANETIETAIRDPRIAAVSFTGSGNAGRIVASIAGSEIKPTVLELGGSDPCIVLADADLESAADVATLSRMINAGQSCIAAKRIIVEDSVYDVFVEKLQSRMAKFTMGDPLLSDTDVGPIAREDLRQNLHRQVTETIAAGATCLLGGELSNDPGFFYPPTLLIDVTEGMCAFKEETFGPIMVVIRAADVEEAVQLANETPYGLGAAVWSTNAEVATNIANRLEAGQVAINGIVKTDSRLPSGGIKGSGYGRELGPHGIREFVNSKQIWVK